jgi:integrase/recombinase XerD
MTQNDVASARRGYLDRYQGSTLATYTHYLDRWLDWCTSAGVEPLGARRGDVEQYVHYLRVETSHRPQAVQAALAPVRGFYRLAHNDGLIDPDPAAMARAPRFLPGPGKLGLDRHDMQALLRLGGQWGGTHQAAVYLLGCLGLSNSEARSIHVENFSRSVRGHRVLEFVGRRGVPALMPLPVPVLRALDQSAAGRTSGPLMLRRDGQRPLDAKTLRTIIRRMGIAADILVPVTPHLLRVSCIVNALDSGSSPRKVQDLARHASVQAALNYDRDRTSHDHHAVHSLMAYLNSPESPGSAIRSDRPGTDRR